MVGGLLLEFSQDGLKWMKAMLKRFIDISFSITGLVIFFPLLVIISLAIKIEDRGPVLFCQERIGRFGKKFTILQCRRLNLISPSDLNQVINQE
jgi:lipopolysaccharide/colanic/teichoic acid biosynthesis glycosyltransferase